MTVNLSRRELLFSAGLAAGTCFVSGCANSAQSSPPGEAVPADKPQANKDSASQAQDSLRWQYRKLDPAVVAAEAYRQVADGGCMYGLFAGIIKTLAAGHGEPYRSFPVHMMRYGEGGVGLWGSLCGTVNGGSAIFGLFEPDKKRRESLISELFSWYETAELPSYAPASPPESLEIPKTVTHSVLCHVSVGTWCLESGNDIGSDEMKERCRRLTADVAAKTVELLNANLVEPCKFAGLRGEVRSCLSCHKLDLHDTMGKMDCDNCHRTLSKKHPAVPCTPGSSIGGPKNTNP
jgi:hypothetical protein